MRYFSILLLLSSLVLFSLGMMQCNFETQEKQVPQMNVAIQEDYPCYNDSIPLDEIDIEKVEVISLKEFEGSGLYKKHCSMCHGNTGRGEGVVARHNPELCPRDLTKIDKPDQCIYYVIINGQNKMPGQGDEMSDQEVWVLIIYVNKLKK